jgi:hypothetical protein
MIIEDLLVINGVDGGELLGDGGQGEPEDDVAYEGGDEEVQLEPSGPILFVHWNFVEETFLYFHLIMDS